MSRQSMNTALKRLMTEYKQLTASESEDSMFTAGPVSEDDFFLWSCLISGPEDTPFEGGVFQAELKFPRDYPLSPPKMRFDPPLFHPNIYANGEVCISILHAPGDDPNSYESASERWSPVQSVEKILLSVISMLAEPNLESGANIDACKMYRDQREEYDETIRAHDKNESKFCERTPSRRFAPRLFSTPSLRFALFFHLQFSSIVASPISPPSSPPLQPYTLHPLLSPIFHHPTSSQPLVLSPTSSPRNTLGSLLNTASSLVSDARKSASPTVGGGGVRSLEIGNDERGEGRVWVGQNGEGKVRVYGVNQDVESDEVVSPKGGFGTPNNAKKGRDVKQMNALELLQEFDSPSPSRRPIDKLSVLPRLQNKAIVLSEGILTFHSTFPCLTPLNVHQFPSLRGVVTYSLDHDELQSTGGGGPEERVQLIAIKKRSVHWLSISNTGVDTIQDLPLPGGANLAVLRRGRICLADSENYSIVDLEAAEALPLLPISQAPNPDLYSRPTSPSTLPDGTQSPSPTDFDPRQKPSIVSVGFNEFLIASHTASTTLGVFVNELGEPCRGTLEWSSNLRSLVVDDEHAVALLWNDTIEIHSLVTQELTQLIQLTDLSSSPIHPKSLITCPPGGLELGGSFNGMNKLEYVSVGLRKVREGEPPSTPQKVRSARTEKRSVGGRGGGNGTRTLLVARNSVWALSPLTLIKKVDALLEKGREEECLKLIEAQQNSLEATYVHLKLAFLELAKTSFKSAFSHFLSSGCDPRIVVRMFDSSNGEGGGVNELISSSDQVSILRGIRSEFEEGKTINDYIMDNLNHNYSPHLQPSVETAQPTIELRARMVEDAKDSLLSYLMKWRIARRETGAGIERGVGGRRSNDSRKIDMVVDTKLVSLLAEAKRPMDIKVLLASQNDCVLPIVEENLLGAGMYGLVAELAGKKGRNEKVLEIWTKLVDAEYEDEEVDMQDLKRQVFDLLWKAKDQALTEKYGLWLIRHDRGFGLRLFNDPKQTLRFDTRELFAKMRDVDEDAADLFLEGAVLQERDTDARLHVDLVKRYLGRLGELLEDSDAKSHIREQENTFAQLEASTSSPPTFLSFLASRYSPDSQFALLDRVRLKAILFLSSSSKYDLQDAKRELEEMEMRGLRLTLERVIVYGKLKLDRQALSLLLNNLRDLSSAETYSLQSGDPLLPSDTTATADRLQLPFKRSRRHHTSAAKREEEAKRNESLARILVEMSLQSNGEGGGEKRIAKILDSQAMNLDTIEILPTIPDSFPLDLLTSFFSRSLRRSLHTHQEASILKNLASGQNLVISERLFRVQEKLGGVVERGEGGQRGGEKEQATFTIEKNQKGEKEITVFPASTEGMSLEEAVELDLR